MIYEEMIQYLKKNSIRNLSEELKVPIITLRKFLYKKGYAPSPPVKKKKIKRPNLNTLDIYGTIIPIKGKFNSLQRQIIVGTLFGDSGIYCSTYEKSAYYRCEHSWDQINYLKAKIELLKPFSFSPYIDKPNKKNQDYQVGFSCHSSEELADYRRIFYTEKVENSKHLQKNILKEEIWGQLSLISVAFWLMDDGKKYGRSYGIVIGKQPYYSMNKLEKCIQILNKNLNTEFYAKEEKICYMVCAKRGLTTDLLKRYILPEFYYKIGINPQDCGEFYRQYKWWVDWQDTRKFLLHPLIEKYPYTKSIFLKLSRDDKKAYKKALYRQIRNRWFPYVTLDQSERIDKFKKLKKHEQDINDGILSLSPIHNTFVNSFMNHRYHLKTKGCLSPYEIFLNNKELKKVIDKQLIDGPNINNSNIRAALSVYRTQGVGQFSTAIAKLLCDVYCPINGKVLDPCSGFGARMAGVVASGKEYEGFEPSTETYKALLDLDRWLFEYTGLKSIIHNDCFEDSDLGNGSYDMALTSPPYYDKEQYSDENTQSSIRYGCYMEWAEKFLSVMIKKVHKALKPGKYFILNIDDIKGYPIIKNVQKNMEEIGFNLIRIYWSSPRKRPGSMGLSSEPFFVYRKVE